MEHLTDDRDGTAAAVRGGLRSPVVSGVAVAVVCLLLTTTLTASFAVGSRDDARTELDRMALDVELQVNRRVEVAESALMALAAQVSTGVASPRELQRVLADTRVVEELPGLLAMVYAAASATEDGPRVAPLAVHPLAPNVSVLGRNILREPERRRAIEAARDSGATTATSIVTHAHGGVDALLVVLPVFRGSPESLADRRATFLGVMMAVVSPTELVADIDRMPGEVLVEDLGPTRVAPSSPTTIWAGDTASWDGARTRTFEVADRTWRVAVVPGRAFPVGPGPAMVVAVAGALLSLLLGLLAGVLVGQRGRLEQLVGARTRELQRANERLGQTNDELERASRLQSQFITTVSHELRTPLTSVIGFVQTVRRMGHADASRRDEFLARAERNGLTLRRMIEELLDFGRLERGEVVLDRRELDVGRAVRSLVVDLEPMLEGRHVTVVTQPDCRAAVDRGALERIVANLMTNALRHAPGGGAIEFSVARCGDEVELTCADRGPGFLARDLPLLCERFVRGTGVMGEGTGIGLSLVRDLARAHGGEIHLRNRDGGGAEVLVSLPAPRTVAPAASSSEPAPGGRELTEVD